MRKLNSFWKFLCSNISLYLFPKTLFNYKFNKSQVVIFFKFWNNEFKWILNNHVCFLIKFCFIRHYNLHGFTYIYIFTNLISTSIHGTRKKQKNAWPGTREKSISNHRPAEKVKNFGSKRKKRPTSSDPLKKIKGYAVSGQKKTKKPSANPAMLKSWS